VDFFRPEQRPSRPSEEISPLLCQVRHGASGILTWLVYLQNHQMS
jgi:hypothetical protein